MPSRTARPPSWNYICKRLLSVEEAAEALGRSVEGIRLLCRDGHLESLRIGARGLLIDRLSVERFEDPPRGKHAHRS